MTTKLGESNKLTHKVRQDKNIKWNDCHNHEHDDDDEDCCDDDDGDIRNVEQETGDRTKKEKNKSFSCDRHPSDKKVAGRWWKTFIHTLKTCLMAFQMRC